MPRTCYFFNKFTNTQFYNIYFMFIYVLLILGLEKIYELQLISIDKGHGLPSNTNFYREPI